jgi:hypothetical protein
MPFRLGLIRNVGGSESLRDTNHALVKSKTRQARSPSSPIATSNLDCLPHVAAELCFYFFRLFENLMKKQLDELSIGTDRMPDSSHSNHLRQPSAATPSSRRAIGVCESVVQKRITAALHRISSAG